MRIRSAVNFIMMAVVVVIMAACAQSPLSSDSGVKVTQDNAGNTMTEYGPGEYGAAESREIQKGCRAWVKEREQQEMGHYNDLSQSDKTFALMHRETMKMVDNVFGKGASDPCSAGTNVWDAYIAYVEENGKTMRQVSKDGFGFAKHATTIYGAVKVADSILDAAGDVIAGDKTTTEIGRDKIESGGNTTQVANSNSADTTKIAQKQIGGEGSNIEPATVENSNPPAIIPKEEKEEEPEE